MTSDGHRCNPDKPSENRDNDTEMLLVEREREKDAEDPRTERCRIEIRPKKEAASYPNTCGRLGLRTTRWRFLINCRGPRRLNNIPSLRK